MDLNSANTAPEMHAAPVIKNLGEIIEESKSAITSELKAGPKKRGRKSNAERAAMAGNTEVAAPEAPIEFKPAGVAPMLRPAFSMLGDYIAMQNGVPEVSFPDDAATALAEQGDLVIGAFFPDVANSKWGALTAFSVSAVMIYFGHDSACKKASRVKKAEEFMRAQNSAPVNSNISGMPAISSVL